MVAERDDCGRDHHGVIGDVAHDVEAEVPVVRRGAKSVLREHGRVDRGYAGRAQQLEEIHDNRERRDGHERCGNRIGMQHGAHARVDARLRGLGYRE